MSKPRDFYLVVHLTDSGRINSEGQHRYYSSDDLQDMVESMELQDGVRIQHYTLRDGAGVTVAARDGKLV